MKLDLQPNVETIIKDPGGKIGGRKDTVGNGEEDSDAFVQAVPPDYLLRPIVIPSIGQDEFDLVGFPQGIQILPADLLGLAASGTFHVDHADGAGVDHGNIEVTAGLNDDSMTAIDQRRDERMYAGLKEGFTAGDLDERTSVVFDLLNDRVDGDAIPT